MYKDIRDYFVQFGAFSDRRISKKEKQSYLARLSHFFEELGYEQKIIQNRHKRNNSYIGIFGDVKRANWLLLTYYDTPVVNFVPTAYHPFDDFQKRRKTIWNYTFSMLLCFFIIFLCGYFYLYPQLNNQIFNFHDILCVILFFLSVYLVMQVSRRMGFAKRNNLVRNTSSVVTMMLYAEEMAKQKRSDEVAFIFVDHGSTSYYSFQVFKQYLKDKQLEKNQAFIFLDVIGNGHLNIVEPNPGDYAISHEQRSQTLDYLFDSPYYIYGMGENKEQNYAIIEEAIQDALKYLLDDIEKREEQSKII